MAKISVMLAEDRLDEAIGWCRRAAELGPADPRHAYTLAFYQHLGGDAPGAVRTLRRLVDLHPGYGDAYVLLGTVHEEGADTAAASACL